MRARLYHYYSNIAAIPSPVSGSASFELHDSNSLTVPQNRAAIVEITAHRFLSASPLAVWAVPAFSSLVVGAWMEHAGAHRAIWQRAFASQ